MSLGARYVCGFGSFDFRNYGDSAIDQRRCVAVEHADICVEARFEPALVDRALSPSEIVAREECDLGGADRILRRFDA